MASRMTRWLWRGTIAVAVVLLVVAGALGWLLTSQGGLDWALARARTAVGDALVIDGATGSLAHGLSIDRLVYEDDSLKLEARDLRLRADLLQLFRTHIGIDTLEARDIALTLKPDDSETTAPELIGLPIALTVERANVAHLSVQADGQTVALDDLALAYAGGPTQHRVRQLRANSQWGRLTLDGDIGAATPFPLTASLSLSRPDPQLPLGVGLELRGNLLRLQAMAAASLPAQGSSAHAQAVLAPFDQRWLASLAARASAIDLATFDASLPHTALTVEVRGESEAQDRLRGTLAASNAQAGPIDRSRIPIAQVGAAFVTDFTTAQLDGLNIDLGAGGSLTGKGHAGADRAQLELAARNLDLRALHSTLRTTRLAGPLQLDIDADKQTLQGTLAQAGMSVTADAMRSGDVIDIRSLRATANGSELSGKGRIGLAAPLRLDANLQLARFDPAQFGDYPRGSINAKAIIAGQLEPRRIDAQWTIADSTLRGQPLASRGSARIEGERLARADFGARFGSNQLDARGAFGRKGDELAWTLDARDLGQLDQRVAGRLQGNGTLSGDMRHPRIAFSANGSTLRAPGVAIDTLTAKGSLGADPDAPLVLDVVVGKIVAQGVQLARVAAKTTGTLGQHEGDLSVRGGDIDVDARLQGGWHRERDWSGRILSLRNRGTYPLELLAPVELALAPQRFQLGRLEARLGDGRLLVQEASWRSEATRSTLTSSGEFARLPASWLIVPAGLGDRIKSSLLLSGQWSLSASPRLNGSVSVRRDAGDLALLTEPAVPLDLARLALDARFVDDRLTAKVDVAAGTSGSATIDAEIAPVGSAGLGADSPLKLAAQVQLASIRPFAALFETSMRVDGRVDAKLQGGGTLRTPRLSGAINADELRLDVPPYGIYLKDGRVRARLVDDVLDISELAISGGAGRFTANGRLPLRLADGNAQLAWRAERFGLLNRPDMRLVLSGGGETTFDGKKLGLKGELRADEGHFEIRQSNLPELGDDVVVVGRQHAQVQREARAPFELDLQLDLGERIDIIGYGLRGHLAGRVRVRTGADGQLLAEGRINTVRARYAAYGQQLVVDRGVLIFDGPIDNPALDIQAWRRNQAVEAGVQVTGTVRAPRVEIVSDPPVPQNERLSWLILGRAPSDTSRNDFAALQVAAAALFSSSDQLPLNQSLARTFGFDDVSLRGSGELSSQVVAVGKRLSDRLYVTYEQGLGVATNLVKLDYSLTRRLSARAETGTSSGFGLFYRYSFD